MITEANDNEPPFRLGALALSVVIGCGLMLLAALGISSVIG